jgi:uncharacterized protein with PhoU and TrkA domain
MFKKSDESDESQPTTVKDILVEMKDVSELMVDLAYSTIIFDSEDMAREVEVLRDKMSNLKYEIRLTAMLAARTPKDAEELTAILQVAEAAGEIANAACDMVTLLDVVIDDRPFLPFLFKDADEKINILEIEKESSILNRKISDLQIESETGLKIIAMKRGRTWLYDPDEETILKPNDVLIVAGTEDAYLYLKKVAEGKEDWE